MFNRLNFVRTECVAPIMPSLKVNRLKHHHPTQAPMQMCLNKDATQSFHLSRSWNGMTIDSHECVVSGCSIILQKRFYADGLNDFTFKLSSVNRKRRAVLKLSIITRVVQAGK